jgi:hypothetical protein
LAGYCEHGAEPSGFTNFCEILEYLTDSCFLEALSSVEFSRMYLSDTDPT